MSESKMSDIIKTSLEGIKNFTEMENAIGNPIQTPSGVTVIPVSKVSIGFATGGVDLAGKKMLNNQNFGGGGGTGVSITPLAFLTIGKNAEVSLIPIDKGPENTLEHALTVIEKSPQIIEKIKNALS